MAALFTKEQGESPSFTPGTEQTIIGPTVHVEGTFRTEDNIRIEGRVTGTIETTQNLTIGSEASIEADITAANLHASGTIKGNINVSGTVELTSSATVHGDITTGILSIETGATVNGRCETGSSTPSATRSSENTSSEPTSTDGAEA